MRYVGALLLVCGCLPMERALVLVQKDTTGAGAVQYVAPIGSDDTSTGIFSASLADDDNARIMFGRAGASGSYASAFLVGFENDASPEHIWLTTEFHVLRFHKGVLGTVALTVDAGYRCTFNVSNGTTEAVSTGIVGIGLAF